MANKEISTGDMVRVKERYDCWLGIVTDVSEPYEYKEGEETKIIPMMYSVKPMGWISTPHRLTGKNLEKVTNELIVKESFL